MILKWPRAVSILTENRRVFMMVIVPNKLRDAINEVIDQALRDCPEAAADREIFYKSS